MASTKVIGKVLSETSIFFDSNYFSMSIMTSYVVGTGITAIVKLTQAEYDALTPVLTTLYIIVG